MKKEHELKTDAEPFLDIVRGIKTFEIRVNDRGFKVGDTLLLRETAYPAAKMANGFPLEYTGSTARGEITFIQVGYGITDGYVVLLFKLLGYELPPGASSEILDPAKTHEISNIGVKKHRHYFKDVSHLDEIDVYRVIDLFGVTDGAIQHALKKLLVTGGRGGGKGTVTDMQDAIDSLSRGLDMIAENERKNDGH